LNSYDTSETGEFRKKTKRKEKKKKKDKKRGRKLRVMAKYLYSIQHRKQQGFCGMRGTTFSWNEGGLFGWDLMRCKP